LEQVEGIDLRDPGAANHGVDLQALASRYVARYAEYKAQKKITGAADLMKVPCVNHPVFKGKPVNHDPREVHVRELMRQHGEHNVFLDFYHAVVKALYDADVSRNVYCVNVDAVIATMLLKLMWPAWRSGQIDAADLEGAAFTTFLYARMLGCAAEADDHLNRGNNMDTRTPASVIRFIA